MPGITDFSNRVAVVTGGASGIGRGIAARLVAEGAHVVIADVDEAAVVAAAREIGATAIVADVTRRENVDALAAAVIERFGKVDLLFNNAGVGPMGRIEDMTSDEWSWLLGVNIWGLIHGLAAFLPHLIANPDGAHIVNTASIVGLAPMVTLPAYSATKFAIVGLSEGLAQDLARDHPQVGVTLLLPGPVLSNLGDSGRNRPKNFDRGGFIRTDTQEIAADVGELNWMDPLIVGDITIAAIRSGALYAVTHPETFAPIKARHEAIAAAFAAA